MTPCLAAQPVVRERSFMSISAIEEEILWSCSDDYEAPHTISTGVGERAEQPASEASVRAALLSLAERGFVQAYRYDKRSGAWVELTPAAAAKEPDAWFRTTALGAQELGDEAS
jgi:hypothetical protein